jgi:hypothetical protein
VFRRKAPSSPEHPVTAFWSWWDREGRRIDPRAESALSDVLTQRLGAIHPDLTWHFGPGTRATHRLTVSAGGLAEVRPTAERWLRAAPAADSLWEFRSSQEADPEALSQVLSIAGETLALSEVSFGLDVDETAGRAHLGVFHPRFAAMPEEARQQVTYLLLDWLVGEDGVERWVGRIEPTAAPPVEPATGDDVRRSVAALAERSDPDEWALGQWRDDDGVPGLATFRPGLRWLDHPTCDVHHVLRMPYSAREDGLPVDVDALDTLRSVEDELLALLGAAGVLVGHQSHRGARTFHVYLDGEDQNAAERLERWAQQRGLQVETMPDPGWRACRRFTG